MSKREMQALAASGALVELDANAVRGRPGRHRKAGGGCTCGGCMCGGRTPPRKSRKFPTASPRDALVNSVSDALDALGLAAQGVAQHDAQCAVHQAQDAAMPQCKALCALAKTTNEAVAVMFGAELQDVGVSPKTNRSPHRAGLSPSSAKRRRTGKSPLHQAAPRSHRSPGTPSATAEAARASPAKSPAEAHAGEGAEPWRKAWPAPSLNARQCGRLCREYAEYCDSGDYGRFLKRGGSAPHRWMTLERQVRLCIELGLSMTRGHEVLHSMWRRHRANCCNDHGGDTDGQASGAGAMSPWSAHLPAAGFVSPLIGLACASQCTQSKHEGYVEGAVAGIAVPWSVRMIHMCRADVSMMFI